MDIREYIEKAPEDICMICEEKIHATDPYIELIGRRTNIIRECSELFHHSICICTKCYKREIRDLIYKQEGDHG